MRRGNLALLSLFAALLLAAGGCASRQLTQSETDRLDAIAAKLAQAEQMGAKDCAPRELAQAQASLAYARHELKEHFEEAEPAVQKAEKQANDLLPLTKQKCAPTASIQVSPPSVEEGGCANLSWTTNRYADSRTIEPGVGAVDPSGSRQVCPSATTEYRITARGKAGEAVASATLAVTPKAPPPSPPPPPPAQPPSIEEPAPFGNIYFDYDKADIRQDAKATLLVVADYLKKNPQVRMQIEGHCDERGTPEYNMALGDRRANAAKKYLGNLGIDAGRLTTISFGEEKPADPGHDETAWAKNRRASFLMK